MVGNWCRANRAIKSPTSSTWANTVVRLQPSALPTSAPVAGTAVYTGTGSSALVSGLNPGQTYTATAYAVDRYGNVSDPTQLVVSLADGFVALPPTRVLDTRTALVPPSSPPERPVGPGQTLTLPVVGTAGVPADAQAVVLNVTATDVTTPTFVTVHPDGVATTTSNLNVVPGDTRANLVTVPVGAGGVVDLTNVAGDVDLVADVAGYYDAAGSGLYDPLTPVRLLDTRTGEVPSGWSADTPIGPGGTLNLTVAGVDGVPADATAVVVNLTAVDPTGGTFLTAYPTGGSQPLASTVNAAPRTVVPNLAVVQVGADGQISLYNFAGLTHVVVDVVGAYSPTGQDLFVPTRPTRLLDTRTSEVPPGWGAATPVGAGQTLDLPVAGATSVPTEAVAVVVNLTGTGPTSSTFVTVYPGGSARPVASDLNLVPGGDATPTWSAPPWAQLAIWLSTTSRARSTWSSTCSATSWRGRPPPPEDPRAPCERLDETVGSPPHAVALNVVVAIPEGQVPNQ